MAIEAGIRFRAAVSNAKTRYRLLIAKTGDRVPMGALGRHEAAELRRLHAELAPGPHVSETDGRLTREFQTRWCETLDHFGHLGGPRDADEDRLLRIEYDRIREGFRTHRFSIRQLQRLLHAEGCKYTAGNPLYSILFRTSGYAGSAGTIEWMHNDMGLHANVPARPEQGYLRFCNEAPCAAAIRDRLATIVAMATSERRRHGEGKPFKVASYASGTGRFATTWLERLERDERENTRVALYDIDPAARLLAERRAIRHGFASRCTFACGNLLSDRVFDVSTSRLEGAFHFAECSGLFDYLSAELTDADRQKGRTVPAFGFMLKKMFRTIAPGGLLVVGNFAKGHVDQAYMELGNWRLLLRDEAELETLARRHAGFCERRGDSISFIRIPPYATQILMLLRKGE